HTNFHTHFYNANIFYRRCSMDKEQAFAFITEQKTAFLGSINENGFPMIRAMLAPRKIEENQIYFTTNTSSNKIKHYLSNQKACVYFYKRGRFKYQGLGIIGTIEICKDMLTKEMIWQEGDTKYYKKGIGDPDYCVLKFTCIEAEYYCDFKKERFVF
ncbi:pyridoxamine 5'-phosphate oxidase family protein, partial [Helicobacter ganmani]|uniref:pyridoxamine 5'-phosphate oxidase family protein n=2 Tax=Helicobacteraceae TaxID=72293 RepID=UPI002639CD33